MTEKQLYEAAYNAHEHAENAALEALYESLSNESIDTLACLCDSSWGWEQRGFISRAVVDFAGDLLVEKLEELVAA